ncbi:hypothetical protein RJ640_021167 [Escallonia rubra]|uniref:Mediator complex subunit 15 KIX domain-containing protein n=1 Tax=Escallonia rubra TaxID=112253 RepID=A0AA88R820_9ASTE|nr:hypothetical protein RJ640_021167 [Escallonia rubra]
MKDMYLADLSEMYQKIAGKLQQHDSLPQQPKNEQLEKLKIFKTMLERLITFLQVPKSSVIPGFKDKLGAYEKQITNFLHSNRPRKPVSSMQQGQALNMHSMQQPQPQMTQMQNHDSQMNPQMQSMNLQGSVATMQQNTMNSLQHNSLSPLLGVSNAQQSMMNSLLPSSTLDPGQNNALNTLQQVAVGSLQHDPVSGPQQVNLNPLSSQGGMNRLQPTLNPLQSNSNMAQHQHLKQQEQMLQNQQFKLQYQQRQMQQHFIQKQQLLQLQQTKQQQQLQQTKQQQPAQLQANQMQQLHQMTVYLGLLGFALIFFLNLVHLFLTFDFSVYLGLLVKYQ